MKNVNTNKIENIVVIISSLDKGTLKDAKALADKAKLAYSGTTKKAFIASLEELKAKLSINPLEALKEVANQINSELASAQQSHMTIGKLLNDNRDMFSNMKDFLSWTKVSCGLQKAQVYNLMKIAKQFGDETVFSKVSMRVLSNLTRCSEEVVAMAKARIEAKKVLNTKALNKLIDSVAPTPSKTPEPSTTPEPVNNDSTPVNNASDNSTTEPSDTPAPSDTPEPSEQENLLAKVEELEEKLAKAKSSLEELVKAKTSAILPQFSNPVMYARLGLSLEQSKDKKEVTKAYRALASIYSATDYPDVSSLLLEARTALTN